MGALKYKRDPHAPELNWRLLREFFSLTGMYWMRRSAWRSWLALALFVIYTLCESGFNALVAKLSGDMLNNLSGGHSVKFYTLMWQLAAVQMGYMLLFLIMEVPYSIVNIHWQRWLTKTFMSDYLRGRNYYLMERDKSLDNPDERMSNDVQLFMTGGASYLGRDPNTEYIAFPGAVFFGMIRALSNLAVFGVVLWHFQPYLVLCCFAWAAFGTLMTLLFNRPILALNFESKKLEGNFRFGLVHVRTHAESIALHGGETSEERELNLRNDAIAANSFQRLFWSTLVRVWTAFYIGFNNLVPVALLAPLCFIGRLDLSGYTQMQNAWKSLDGAFSYFGTQVWSFATQGALIGRLFGLKRECQKPISQRNPYPTVRQVVGSAGISARHLNLWTPDGTRQLIQDLDLTVGPGETLLIEGVTGSGKSSLVRGLAGLWNRGSGEVVMPPKGQLMFLPQRPYSSLGNLREQVAYPLDAGTVSDERLRQVLKAVQLEYLELRFGGWEAEFDWEHVLSPGEQQRLAFARVLLRRPQFVILDEATSALDVAGEAHLYGLLGELGCAFISVGHRPTIQPFHKRRLRLTGDGQWQVAELPS